MKFSNRWFPFYPIFFLFRVAALNQGIGLRKIPLFSIFIVRYFLFEPFRLMEIILFEKKINKHELKEDPIFVLGHWRSGTSYLQGLLSQNKAYTSYTIYTFLFADVFILTQDWLKPILNAICKLFKIPFSFQRTIMDLDTVGELESAMCSLCSPNSYTWGQLFSKKFKDWMIDFVQLNDAELTEKWITDYDYLIRKLSYCNKGKRVLVKSPGDTGRSDLLLKKYPNAKFIFIERSPIDVFHSSRYLWSIIQKENSFNEVSNDQIDDYIIFGYKLLFDNYLEFKKIVPKNQLIEVRFDDLVTQPIDQLKAIYLYLSLKDFKESDFIDYLKSTINQKKSTYSTSKQLKARLTNAWEPIFEIYNRSN